MGRNELPSHPQLPYGHLFKPFPLLCDLAHANCTLFFTSRATFVCKKKTRSFRVFPPEN